MAHRVLPLPAATADRLRATATVVRVADESPGYPCRACLRDAEVGDELVLVSYDPFDTWPAAASSPYRTPSPVFVHRHDCSGNVDGSELPEQLVRRRLSVRAFDEAAMMVDGRVVEGTDLATLLDELATRADVARVHVHNAAPGCFAAEVLVGCVRGTPDDGR